MVTLPLWLLIILIVLALGGISITFNKTEKKEKPAAKVVRDASQETLLFIYGNLARDRRSGFVAEPKDASYNDAFRMVCIDEEKQTYIPLVQAQRLAYAYFMREGEETFREEVIRPQMYREQRAEPYREEEFE